jgi:hypothetical protein
LRAFAIVTVDGIGIGIGIGDHRTHDGPVAVIRPAGAVPAEQNDWAPSPGVGVMIDNRWRIQEVPDKSDTLVPAGS